MMYYFQRITPAERRCYILMIVLVSSWCWYLLSFYLNGWTNWGPNNTADILDTTFSKVFFQWNSWHFDTSFTEVCSQRSNWWYTIIDLGNGLPPKRQQSSTWGKGDPAQWRIYIHPAFFKWLHLCFPIDMSGFPGMNGEYTIDPGTQRGLTCQRQ